MEALRTKIDGLQWEVHWLGAENRKLREDNPGASERIDREAELEKTKYDVAELTNHVKVLERQLAERTSTVEDAELRAERAEARAAELEKLTEIADRSVAGTMSEEETTRLRAAVRVNEESLGEAQRELREWERRWSAQERQDLVAKEALLQQAEQSRYRAVEEERLKWEVRESRLFTQLTATWEELQTARTATADTEEYRRTEEQLQRLTDELHAVESLVRSVMEENRQLVGENLRRNQEYRPAGEMRVGLAGSRRSSEELQLSCVDGGCGTHILRTIDVDEG